MAKPKRPMTKSAFIAIAIAIVALLAVNIRICLKHLPRKEPLEELKVHVEQLRIGDVKSKAEALRKMVPLCARLRERSLFVQEPVAKLLEEHYELVLKDEMNNQDSSSIVISSLFILGNALPQSAETKVLLKKVAAGPPTQAYASLARRALSRGTIFEAEKKVKEAEEMVKKSKETLGVD